MVQLVIGNRYVQLVGLKRAHKRAIEEATSYLVAGFMFSPSFKRGWWDGKEHLLTFSEAKGYRIPTGLLADVVTVLEELEVDHEFVDARPALGERRKLRWNTDIVMRPYQNEAIRSVSSDLLATGREVDRLMMGVGTVKMPIRSGKTKTAGKIIHLFGYRVLFIVPSQMLLNQTIASLQECFPDESIGMIGDGEWTEGFITVATIQTLSRKRGRRKDGDKAAIPMDPRYKALVKKVDHVIDDELHHIKGGGEWHKVVHDFASRFMTGLSATIFMDKKVEQERGIIWAKATCGPVRVDIEESRLIREGYLMRQHVRMYTIKTPTNIMDMKWSATLKDLAITCNKSRNRKIALLTQEVAKTMSTLIVCNRIAHINNIAEELDRLGLRFEIVTGRDNSAKRADKVECFTAGEYNILLGTVFGEGIDIPNIEVVVNAEGGRDAKATTQRMRNMTVSEGKKMAMLIDFYDATNKYFEKHSKERLEVYNSQPEYDVQLFA
jgi:superfamily II DNA or RNA helicase